MSLIISIGSNMGNRKSNLGKAKAELSKIFQFLAESKIYETTAVDYLDQPDFLNQLLEFDSSSMDPFKALKLTQKIEAELGRVRIIDKGPRTIDIDFILWDEEVIHETHLIIPHPAWQKRNFIQIPLRELPAYQNVSKKFRLPVYEMDSTIRVFEAQTK